MPAVALQCYIHSLLSSLITGSPSHTMLYALSPVRLSLSTFAFAFPPLSLCGIHCIAVDSDSYKYPVHGLAERQANRPSLFPFVCVRFWATTAPSVSSHLCFTFPRHLSDLILPIATCHSRLQTRAFHSLVISLPSRLDCCPITHICSSGNNKPHTPLPFTLAHVLPLETSLRFYFYIAHFWTLAWTHTPLYTDAESQLGQVSVAMTWLLRILILLSNKLISHWIKHLWLWKLGFI